MTRIFSIFARIFLVPIIENFFIEKIEGQDNIPQGNNFILAPNHQSYLDHLFIVIPFQHKLEKMHFIGKMETPLHPILFGPIYFFTETITVNRKSKNRRKVLKKALQYLTKGKIIIIYPEGGTNTEEVLKEGKTGIAELALKTEIPIIPVGISNKRNSHKRIIKIGKPIYAKGIINEDILHIDKKKEYKLALERVTVKVMEAISKLCGKKYPYYKFK